MVPVWSKSRPIILHKLSVLNDDTSGTLRTDLARTTTPDSVATKCSSEDQVFPSHVPSSHLGATTLLSLGFSSHSMQYVTCKYEVLASNLSVLVDVTFDLHICNMFCKASHD